MQGFQQEVPEVAVGVKSENTGKGLVIMPKYMQPFYCIGPRFFLVKKKKLGMAQLAVLLKD